MRSAIAIAMALVLAGCGVRLDEPAPAPAADPAPAVTGGCRPFEADGVTRVSGRISAVDLANGSTLLVAGAARVDGKDVDNVGFVVAGGAGALDCYAGATRLPDAVVGPSASGPLVEALAPVVADGERWLFYAASRWDASADFGIAKVGYGVARWDDAAKQFVPGADLLWTADRPSFGSAAVVEGGRVYVYGCVDTSFSADCYVARAPVDRIDDAGAYEYSSGGTHFTSDIDEAWPVLSASDPVSVVADPAGARWLMLYAPVLGSTVTVRSGLSPAGPWSNAFDVASCDLPDKEAFCTGVTALGAPAGGALRVSYAIATFTAGAAASDPAGYWTRVASVTLPAELPRGK